jgi:anti-sigma regulatory factor (Ser/Thr protein kinase)
MRAHGLCGQALNDFESAVGEALANAAEHGHVAGSNFQVYARFEDGAVTVEVKDDGPGFAGWRDPNFVRPASDAPRGLGLFIMGSLMDKIEFADGGTRVRLFRQYEAASLQGRQQQA